MGFSAPGDGDSYWSGKIRTHRVRTSEWGKERDAIGRSTNYFRAEKDRPLWASLWHKVRVQVWLERFVLALLSASFLSLVILNPMKFDLAQRITLGIAIVAFSYFVGHTIYITRLGPVHESPGSARTALGEQLSATQRAHLHITGFHFTAPTNPGGRAEIKVMFTNNSTLTAQAVSLGRMAFFVADSDKPQQTRIRGFSLCGCPDG